MSDHQRPKPNRLLLLVGLACGACCALPFVGLLFGSSVLSGLSLGLQTELGVGVLLLSIAVLVWFWRRQRRTSCRLDASKPEHSSPSERS